jgi:putative ABC transport system permease protein
MRMLAADLRYAVRVLFRAPAFTCAVIAVLAIGIGANTAIFSIVNAVLLRPMPYEAPERLVRVFHVPPQSSFPGMKQFAVSPANFFDWQHDARLFENMSLYRFRSFTTTADNNPQMVRAGAVDARFFDVIGTRPSLGRMFLPEEDSPAHGHVAILSDGFWRRQFGGAADIVGRTMRLNGEPYTIVGVMPRRFTVTAWEIAARDIWVPIALTADQRAVRDNHNEQVVARLKPGVSVAQAQAEMDAISLRLAHDYPKENAGWGATLVLQQQDIVGNIQLSLVMLLGSVALVLLIACANVANLMFARALARRKELAIRAALGAGRARVFQQLLIESLVLAIGGGVAGLLIANASLGLGAALLADQIPRADEVSLDARVLLFVAAASIIAGLLAGGIPALRAGRTDLNEALKEGGRSDSTIGLRTRRLLVICEVALSLMLLMSAAVMSRSLLALRHVETGFDSHNLLTMEVALPFTKYGRAKFERFFGPALERVRALPGVESAGGIDSLPSQGGSVQPVVPEGRPELSSRDQPAVAVRLITPGYLRALHIPVLRGRDVKDDDHNVLLVSRAAAKVVWGDTDPLGHRATLPLAKTPPGEVIGIVEDVKQYQLSQPIIPTVYLFSENFPWNSLVLVMRSSGSPTALAQPATAVIHALDPEEPVQMIRTMDQVLDETLTSQRFSALLLALFAVVALLLASVGIYSVLSYIVSGRSREIGIRTVLGANRADVLRLVVIEGMTPTLIGIAAGILGALASARILAKLVFGVSASDPLTLALVATTLAQVALAASLVPAYRASRLDPLTVLRET